MPSLLQPDNNNERNPSGNEEVLLRRQVVNYAIKSLEYAAGISFNIYETGDMPFDSTPIGAPNSNDMTQAAAIAGSPKFKYEKPHNYNQSSSIDFAREKVDESLQDELEL